MHTHFQIKPIEKSYFEDLFSLDDAALAQQHIIRKVVDKKPGYPCRVSLQDAEPGETVLLLNYQHLAPPAVYQASGPVYVRVNATTANLAVDEIPEILTHRLLSVRAYTPEGMMQQAVVTEGQQVREVIQSLFDNQQVGFLHIHNARPGCFNCVVERATAPVE